MKGRCCRCDSPTSASYGLCRPCLKNFVTESRAKQGLPPTVEDEATLRKLGAIVASQRKDVA